MFDHDLQAAVINRKIDFLSYTTARIQYVRQLSKVTGVHVIRDPRDIAVSAYYSHLHSHPTEEWPWLVEHRQRLQNCSKDEGLLLEMKYRRDQFQGMLDWDYSHPGILELRMEDMMEAPYRSFLKIFQFFGILNENPVTARRMLAYLPRLAINRRMFLVANATKGRIHAAVGNGKLPAERLLGFVLQNDFQKKAGGRKEGEEDVRSHFRKGVAGDWKNHFKDCHRKYFKTHYSNLLIKLGYERDQNW